MAPTTTTNTRHPGFDGGWGRTRPYINKGKTCSESGCGNKADSRGLCWTHSRQGRGRFCSLTGCASPEHSHGLCSGHYHRKWRGEPDWDRPIKTRKRSIGSVKSRTTVRIEPWAAAALKKEAKARGLSPANLYAYVLEGWARDYAVDDTDEAELGPAAVSSGVDFKKVAVVRAYVEGDMSASEIAAEFGVSDKYVYRAIEAAGVPTRQEKH